MCRYHPFHRRTSYWSSPIYLRLSGLKLGLVINFGERMVKNGIHRVDNRLQLFAPLRQTTCRNSQPPPTALL